MKSSVNIYDLCLEIEQTPILAFASEMPTYSFVQRLNRLYGLDLEHFCRFDIPVEFRKRPDWLPDVVSGDLYFDYDATRHLFYLFAHVAREESRQGTLGFETLNRLLMVHGDEAPARARALQRTLDEPLPREMDFCDPRAMERMRLRKSFCTSGFTQERLITYSPPKPPAEGLTGDPMVDGMFVVKRKPKGEDKPLRKSRLLKEYDDPMLNLGQLLLGEANRFFQEAKEREQLLRDMKVHRYSNKEIKSLLN